MLSALTQRYFKITESIHLHVSSHFNLTLHFSIQGLVSLAYDSVWQCNKMDSGCLNWKLDGCGLLADIKLSLIFHYTFFGTNFKRTNSQRNSSSLWETGLNVCFTWGLKGLLPILYIMIIRWFGNILLSLNQSKGRLVQAETKHTG